MADFGYVIKQIFPNILMPKTFLLVRCQGLALFCNFTELKFAAVAANMKSNKGDNKTGDCRILA